MERHKQHVVLNSDGTWALRKDGAVRATKIFNSKQKAIAYGIAIAKNQHGDLYIHNENGMVSQKIVCAEVA